MCLALGWPAVLSCCCCHMAWVKPADLLPACPRTPLSSLHASVCTLTMAPCPQWKHGPQCDLRQRRSLHATQSAARPLCAPSATSQCGSVFIHDANTIIFYSFNRQYLLSLLPGSGSQTQAAQQGRTQGHATSLLLAKQFFFHSKFAQAPKLCTGLGCCGWALGPRVAVNRLQACTIDP